MHYNKLTILPFFFRIALAMALFYSPAQLYAQKKNFKSAGLDSTLRSDNNDETLHLSFPNIGKSPYYHDKHHLGEIAKAERKKDWEEAVKLTEKYVQQFGIQNFYKDTELLWKLGQLYEITGREQQARATYRMILKHSRHDVTHIKLHYDTLALLHRDDYVPLEFYYELVEYRRQIDTIHPPHSVLTNMGNLVNSKYEDYGPSLNVKNDMLFFTSKRNVRGTIKEISNEDIFMSQGFNGFWDEAVPVNELNTQYNEGSVCINHDATVIYFSRCNTPDSYGDCDLYMSEKNEDGKWQPAKNLGININSKGWDSQPCLSHSEDTLYFASDRIGGFGLSDIYMSVKNEKGEWQPAQNLGPIINTRDSEVSPYFHPKYNVLYFSSRGQLVKFGDFDIYKSYIENEEWMEPKNVGPLVNGKGSEYYFTIDSESKLLFYARSEHDDIRNLDIFSFPLPMEAHPNAVTHFRGKLLDSITNEPFHGIVSVIDINHGREVAPKFLRPDGSFDFDLIDQNDYLLVIQGEDFFRIEQIFHLNGDTSFTIKTPSLKFKHLQFTSLVFETGKWDILENMKADLNKLFNYMADNPELKLIISGHTDSEGKEEDNQKLSQRRADAIKTYISYGGLVDEMRIKAIGYGSAKPLVKEELTEEDKKTNRRVEFEIIKPGEDESYYDN